MFEGAEQGARISKHAFKQRAPQVRTDLLAAQQALRAAPFPVIILFAGVDGAGKRETISLLNEWMDPRWIVTRAYDTPSAEERERPEYWRYWRDLPPKGRIGLYLSTWYSQPILDRVYRRARQAKFDSALERILVFERTLTDAGALFLKFWMHLGQSAQRERLETLERYPDQRWRVTKVQWRHWKRYDRFNAAAERAIRHTDVPRAVWHLVDGADERYRSLTVAVAVRDAIRQALDGAATQPPRRTRSGRRTQDVATQTLDAVSRRHSALSGLVMTRPPHEAGVQDQARGPAGPPEPPPPPGSRSAAFCGRRLRRVGRLRKRGRHPASYRRPGRPSHAGHSDRRPHG